jgi:amino acid adenylation domain-containing protein
VCVERGVDLVPALVGVVKSGGGYVPLDPAYPVDRWGFMLADTGASVVVASAGLAARVAEVFSGSVVVLGSELVAGQPVEAPVPVAGADDVLYVIYTSGSTGQPKGVCVTHANVLRLLACGRQLYGFAESDVWPLFHSYAFDVSVWELWGALLYGGRLVVVEFAVARAPEEFLDLLVAHRVTVLNQTPSAFGGLVAAAAAGDRRVDELALRLVVFAGEKLEIAQLAPWVARRGLDAPVLANMYGITETTVHSTFYRITAADLDPAAGNPIGVPLADLGIYLLDPHGNPVPIGVPGEIYVGGPGVTRGYLNRPALTAQRFVPDPFGPPGARLYRSGDLARRAADTSLQFLGRRDDQVKIRGYRIELGEIQAALRGHPQVTDAVVIATEDTPGDKRLLAYLVPTAGAHLDPHTLRAHLATTLPDYMQPARYLTVDHIPLTTNGKLDRTALPTADHDPLHPATQQPPRTPLEHRIATAWADILTLDHIGIHDNFFDAGGSSILALRISAWIREAFDLDYPVRLIFEGPTVAQAAATVEARLRAEIAALTDDQLIAPPMLPKERLA